MNLEFEGYEGELRNLRKFRDEILAEVELPDDVVASIRSADYTDMTKNVLLHALKSINVLKNVSKARSL